jgi:hypothetical protein
MLADVSRARHQKTIAKVARARAKPNETKAAVAAAKQRSILRILKSEDQEQTA